MQSPAVYESCNPYSSWPGPSIGASRQLPHKASLSGIHMIRPDTVIVAENPRSRNLVELLPLLARRSGRPRHPGPRSRHYLRSTITIIGFYFYLPGPTNFSDGSLDSGEHCLKESMDYYIRRHSHGSDLGSTGKVKHLQSQMNAGSRTGNGGANRSSRSN